MLCARFECALLSKAIRDRWHMLPVCHPWRALEIPIGYSQVFLLFRFALFNRHTHTHRQIVFWLVRNNIIICSYEAKPPWTYRLSCRLWCLYCECHVEHENSERSNWVVVASKMASLRSNGIGKVPHRNQRQCSKLKTICHATHLTHVTHSSSRSFSRFATWHFLCVPLPLKTDF